MLVNIKRIITGILITLCLSAAQYALAKSATIHDVRLWRAPDSTRIVFDLDQAIEHKIFTLSNPDRVVIDIPNAAMSANLSKIELKDSPIVAVRSGANGANMLRIVLDLSHSVKAGSFFLKKSGRADNRLVLDLKDIAAHQKTATKTMNDASSEKRNLVIAIDAGHGGEDPGALGPNNIYEKKVVFAIAQQLENYFNKEKGYKAVMVRTGDYFVGLKDRREIARKAHADMFVSIHADAFKNPQAHGSSVYSLSSKGASSASAQFLADSENQSDLVGGVSLNDKDALLSSVLVDLSMTYKMESSLEVGANVLHNMGAISRLHSTTVEQAAFAVLKTPDIPSILVETGFISNPTEAKKLDSRHYQQKMARAIFQGIDGYFQLKAPEGSYIAWKYKKPDQNLHLVEKGDTLSGIANRYAVSMNTLRNHNRLSSNSLQIGQKLIIPVTN